MDDPVYQVVLHGRKVGPYDRRTIIGMRIKKTLTSEDVVITSDGVQLTVGDLVRARPRDNSFQPNRSGTYSLVQATYSASLLDVQGKGFDIPAFKDEIEARVQQDVLRMAGRFRQGLAWKEDRIKLPLEAIAHARVRGSVVDLWMKPPDAKGFQQLSLELFTHEMAGEFVEWLPKATPWPGGVTAAPARRANGTHPLLWGAVVGTVAVVGGVLVWVLSRGL